MSGLPPIATELRTSLEVRFVPDPDSCTAANICLFDHLVGAGDQRQRDGEAERLCGFEVDRKPELRWMMHREPSLRMRST